MSEEENKSVKEQHAEDSESVKSDAIVASSSNEKGVIYGNVPAMPVMDAVE